MNKNESTPNSSNLAFIEGLYADYLRDPASVSSEWQGYFKQLLNGEATTATMRLGPSFRARSLFNPSTPARNGAIATTEETEAAGLQERVNQLIRNYRVLGHMIARIDPLGL